MTSSPLPRALILAPFEPAELEELRRVCEITYESWMDTSELLAPEELIERIDAQQIQILLVEADFVFDEVFEQAESLRFVGICRGSTDNVDIDAATESGVTVVNAPGRNAVSVAELTVGLIISLARGIPAANSLVKNGEWEDPVSPYITMRGLELSGKTAGIIGYGAVGREVARRLEAFDMQTKVFDPYIDKNAYPSVAFTELDELLKSSDFVSIHCPVTSETEGLIDASRLALMKPSSYLVNTARWEILNSDDVISALKEKHIAGAAFDVFETHPLSRRSPLLAMDNVLLTPHMGGATDGVIARYSKMMADDIRRFLRNEKPLYMVNPEVWDSNAR